MGTTFGSTTKEELPDEGMVIAKKTRDKTATMAGVSITLQIHEQRFKDLYDKLRNMENYCRTLEKRMEDFQKQRGIELQARVNGGPTST